MPSLCFRSELQPIVIYHDNCLDGFTAAWIADKALTGLHKKPMLVPDTYTTGLCTKSIPYWPFDAEGCDIYIVDFSYPGEIVSELCHLANSVTIIDHHASAIKKLNEAFPDLESIPDNLTMILDTSRSGCGLTWEFFNPFYIAPKLVEYVQDRDLWKFLYPETRAFCEALFMAPMNIDSWTFLAEEKNTDILVQDGNILLRAKEGQIASLLPNIRMCWINNHVVPVVNCPAFLASDVGNRIMQELDPPFSATYFDGPAYRHWSLRSTDKALDVSVIAESMEGGGHRNAAGFTTEIGFDFAPALPIIPF